MDSVEKTKEIAQTDRIMEAKFFMSSFVRRSRYEHSALLFYVFTPVWFASFWTVVGTIWRPPWASIGLIVFFLIIVGTMEWARRRWAAKCLPVGFCLEEVQGESGEETVLLQMIRSKTSEGLARMDGTCLAEFSTEALTTTVHIPFCPVFDRVPNVQVFIADETDVQLRITSTKPFGVRVDVRRKNLLTDKIHFVITAEG